MKMSFNMELLLSVLLVSLMVSKCVRGQTCQQSLPSQYDPNNDPSRDTSNQNTFYLYPDFFSTALCTGSISSIQYRFCYLFNENAESPATVFTVLILSSEGLQYRILHSFTEIENRTGCIFNSNTCCKTVSLPVMLNIQRNLSLGFLILAATGGNNLYASSAAQTSQGFRVSSVVVSRSDVGSTIDGSSFQGVRQSIRNRRFSLNYTIESLPLTTSTPLSSMTTVITGDTLSATTVLVPDVNIVRESGSSSGGAIAAGVITGLLMVCVTVVSVIVVVVLLLRRREKQKESPNGFDNHLYERALASNSIAGNDIILHGNNKELKDGESSHHYDVIQGNDARTYEVINASPYLTPVSLVRSMKGTNGVGQSSREDTTYCVPLLPGGFDPYGDPFASGSGSTVRSRGTLQSHDEPIYQNPAENETALYEQYQRINIAYINSSQISTTDVLGSGQFGVVFKGEWTMVPGEERGKLDVAVKMLKDGATEKDRVKFLQEAAIIGQFSHPNIVKLYGIVTAEQKMIILELLLGGDLHHALIALNPNQGEGTRVNSQLPHTLLSYCRQVASGMEYLERKCFIHRDLAARNILLSKDDICKITDFGMSRDLAHTNHYVSHGGKVPVRWTAPEAIHFRTYSTASDVWSFGCVMYEIWSLGHKPFENYSNLDCIKLVNEGVRLPPPPGCPRAIYELMIDCWHPDSSSRPDFVSVVQQLSLPDTKLLKWSEEDRDTDPEAATLGAGLDKAVDLYRDLQELYML